MKILIRSAKIIQKGTALNGQLKDIFIENGIIRQIGEGLTLEADEVISHPNLCVSLGWFDMRVHAKDPGYEQKESLYSLEKAALAGGFSEIALLPNTKPTVQTRESVHYLKKSGDLIKFHPMAAVTLKCEGKDFTEMIDLHHAGAVAFTDGEHPIQNPDILLKTLQYLTPLGGVLINRPEDMNLTHFGQMHEGFVSTLIGMKGMPRMAEEISVMRDLKLLEYVMETPFGTPNTSQPLLHFACISTAESVSLIREAKAKGLPVSCDVAVHQLCFTEEDLLGFDTNYKVNPPFRTQTDVQALWAGLVDGTIDAIVSDHNPQDEEAKNLEFDMADFGIIGLETLYAVANSYNIGLSTEDLIEKITVNPRYILRLPIPEIKEGSKANLTLFNEDEEWVYKDIVSNSKNSPFVGKTLRGKSIAVIV
ncbi:dihydroorotase [Flectobacillus major]|jgi:dihydroorotase|uniref:dihydroorotase n=1 Tax=Flectobacillus major TaxID=103 RepID=UPI000417C092|nr:dihydroorotase [Flectobacillus major]